MNNLCCLLGHVYIKCTQCDSQWCWQCWVEDEGHAVKLDESRQVSRKCPVTKKRLSTNRTEYPVYTLELQP